VKKEDVVNIISSYVKSDHAVSKER
jgi:hypothetical protein